MIKEFGMLNRIILSLVMLISGLLKLFVIGVGGVSGMLSGVVLFAWAPLFWAWILIIFEIGTGIAIFANWKVQYTAIPPAIIIFIAAFTVNFNWADLSQVAWPNVLLHLAVVSNYLLLACHKCK
jgi:uncharacterized membrane protein YphA (DoxX/SURF4 family)